MQTPRTHEEILAVVDDITAGVDISPTEVAAEYRRRTGVTDPDDLANALVVGLDLEQTEATAAIDLLDDEEPKPRQYKAPRAPKGAKPEPATGDNKGNAGGN